MRRATAVTAIVAMVAMLLVLGVTSPADAEICADRQEAGWILESSTWVPGNGDDVDTADTDATKDYRLVASGTWDAGDAGYYLADAEWLKVGDAEWANGYEGDETVPDLRVDGAFVDWGTFNEDHVYSRDVTGTGDPFTLDIYDLYYGNNGGGLCVYLYREDDAAPDFYDVQIGASIDRSQLVLTGTAFDTQPLGGSNITSVSYRIDAGAWLPATFVTGPGVSRYFEATFSLPKSLGTHDVTVKAVDGAGNVATQVLADRFETFVFAGGAIVGTTGSNDKGTPDWTVDAVAGYLAGQPIGAITVNYKDAAAVRFTPSVENYGFSFYEGGIIDLEQWTSAAGDATSIQFRGRDSVLFGSMPRGGMYVEGAAGLAITGAAVAPHWGYVPLDRGNVHVAM